MFSRQLLNEDTACASYLLGCKSRSAFAVVDPHIDLVAALTDIPPAPEQQAAIVAAHRSGRPLAEVP